MREDDIYESNATMGSPLFPPITEVFLDFFEIEMFASQGMLVRHIVLRRLCLMSVEQHYQ